MKKFYIVANPDKENTKNMQTAIEEYLTTRGAKSPPEKVLPDMEIPIRILRMFREIWNVSSHSAATEP